MKWKYTLKGKGYPKYVSIIVDPFKIYRMMLWLVGECIDDLKGEDNEK